MSDDVGEIVVSHPNVALCPVCQHRNSMPSECLREHWQAMDCGRCARPMEYRGRHIDGDYEIVTRPDVAKTAAGLTKAQRVALRDGVFQHASRGQCLRAHRTVRYNLCWLRLLRDYLGTPSLTPLGLAVRQHILEQN